MGVGDVDVMVVLLMVSCLAHVFEVLFVVLREHLFVNIPKVVPAVQLKLAMVVPGIQSVHIHAPDPGRGVTESTCKP